MRGRSQGWRWSLGAVQDGLLRPHARRAPRNGEASPDRVIERADSVGGDSEVDCLRTLYSGGGAQSGEIGVVHLTIAQAIGSGGLVGLAVARPGVRRLDELVTTREAGGRAREREGCMCRGEPEKDNG